MIRLSGHEVGTGRDSQHSVDIEFIGLRPGEKLHEELLLGTSVSGTGHPMIMRAEEASLTHDDVLVALRDLQQSCDVMDCQAITRVLSEAVDGFSGHEVWHDHIWIKQGRAGKRRVMGPPESEASNVKTLFPQGVKDA
jgi:FlaA1/EpsC-like NDP-sugar epimerase